MVVALLLLASGSSYTLRADFQDAGGLVTGNQVLIGPANGRHGRVDRADAERRRPRSTISLDSNAAPMHEGTVARIYENSLSGIANKYVVLEPGPSNAPAIPSGGLIREDHTYSFVSLDQLFDTLDPLTRAGLQRLHPGEAASIQGRAAAGEPRRSDISRRRSPSTSDVTAELTRDEPAFDGLLVQGAQAMQPLASRSQQLTQLIANGEPRPARSRARARRCSRRCRCSPAR